MCTEPTYFWSGSNRAGEVLALAKHGRGIGVAIDALDRGGRGMAALLALAPPRRMIVGVTRASGGTPILMFNRDRTAHAGLPTGDVPVDVAGLGGLVLGFRKVAVNVARRARDGANVLAEALRGIFGAEAGTRGQRHKVAFELTPAGWQMSRAELDALAGSEVPVFVDSGAFGEVQFNDRHKCSGRLKACKAGTCVGNGNWKFPTAEPFTFVDVRPITHADWIERLDAYGRIAAALKGRAFLVAPDKVGDQAETLRRLALYAPRIRTLRKTGANIIVPIQRGEIAGADFDRQCSEILGFSDYIRGIPSKKAAASVEEIGALSRSLPADARVHLLGLGPFGDRYAEVIAAIDRAPALVTCDSVRIKALVGRDNGPGGGPRILTQLTDMAKKVMGLTGRQRLNAEQADRVKFWTLDRYFTHHFEAA